MKQHPNHDQANQYARYLVHHDFSRGVCSQLWLRRFRLRLWIEIVLYRVYIGIFPSLILMWIAAGQARYLAWRLSRPQYSPLPFINTSRKCSLEIELQCHPFTCGPALVCEGHGREPRCSRFSGVRSENAQSSCLFPTLFIHSQSELLELNQRPLAPKASALPD